MPLTPDEIKALLNKPAPTRAATGKKIDTSNRDTKTWFALAHKIFDEETQGLATCSNPNCLDPREGKGTVVAQVNGVYMCRYCFFDGYMLHVGQVALG